MIGRIVWCASLAGIALLTAGLQLDVLAAETPSLVPFVPEPFRNVSQTAITRAALAGNDGGRALAEAQRLVQRRPVPARSLVLLTVAQAKAGKAEQAAKTIQVAAHRGWREPLAQEAMLRFALAAGDKAEAARRYAALFGRQATPDALLTELGPKVLGEPRGAGRSTFAGIIAGADRWHQMFLRRGSVVMPADAFVEIVATAANQGVRFDCGTLQNTVKGLRQRDAAAAAQLTPVVAERCPS